jgi:hypothetical protein
VSAASGTVYKGPVGRIKFTLAHFLLDNFGPWKPEAAKTAHNYNVGGGAYKTHAAETSDLASDKGKHRNFSPAFLNPLHNFSVRKKSGVGFVQAHPARFKRVYNGG